jgi:hypothetical protein
MLRRVLVGLLASLGLTSLVGCMPARTCNAYGCSDPAQAVTKIAENRLDDLNPADVQVLGEVVERVGAVNLPALTAEQAWAVVQLIETLGITTFDSIEPAIRAAQADPNLIAQLDPGALAILLEMAQNPDAWVAAGVELQSKLGSQ